MDHIIRSGPEFPPSMPGAHLGRWDRQFFSRSAIRHQIAVGIESAGFPRGRVRQSPARRVFAVRGPPHAIAFDHFREELLPSRRYICPGPFRSAPSNNTLDRNPDFVMPYVVRRRGPPTPEGRESARVWPGIFAARVRPPTTNSRRTATNRRGRYPFPRATSPNACVKSGVREQDRCHVFRAGIQAGGKLPSHRRGLRRNSGRRGVPNALPEPKKLSRTRTGRTNRSPGFHPSAKYCASSRVIHSPPRDSAVAQRAASLAGA